MGKEPKLVCFSELFDELDVVLIRERREEQRRLERIRIRNNDRVSERIWGEEKLYKDEGKEEKSRMDVEEQKSWRVS